MASPTQDGRIGKLLTPLGEDKLLLVRLQGTEAMGELFEWRIEALSPDPNLDFGDALGRNCSVHLETTDAVGRDYSGVLAEARWLGPRGDLNAYSLVLRPWLWLLSLSSDCRIFKNMDAKAIIKQVFSDRHFSDLIDLTAGDYPELEYCVQYRETDLNFVLRLMELYGIYYYFQFQPGGGGSPSSHLLVLADSVTHVPLPAPAKIEFLPRTATGRRDTQQFNTWNKSDLVASNSFALRDYNYEKPQAAMGATSMVDPNPLREIYNFPGGYDVQDVGLKFAGVAVHAEQARRKHFGGGGYAPSVTPGFTITRAAVNGPDPDDGDYLVLRCNHHFGDQGYESGDANDATYSGAYEMMKSNNEYRMPQRTRKPVIVGSQSAVVVPKQGEESEEISVDDTGRILVRFFWDREDKSSRWIRIAQQWAGKNNRGFWFLPRIGDEVLVQYIEGDPDRPVVVGSVYNGDHPTALKMAEHKTHSGIVTDSTKGSTGFNKLLFVDTAGDELVGLRAQKDLHVKVLHDENRDVGRNQTEQIGGSVSQSVGGSVTQSIGGDDTITVGGPSGGGTFSLTAMQKIVLKVGASTLTIDPVQIKLEAPIVDIEALGLAKVHAAVVQVQGDGIAMMTAPATMIGQNVMVAPMLVTAQIVWAKATGAPPLPA